MGLGDVQVPCCSAWNIGIHSVFWHCCTTKGMYMTHFLKRFKALEKHSGILTLEETFYSLFSWSTPEHESLRNSEKVVMYYCGETGWSPVSNTYCTEIHNWRNSSLLVTTQRNSLNFSFFYFIKSCPCFYFFLNSIKYIQLSMYEWCILSCNLFNLTTAV